MGTSDVANHTAIFRPSHRSISNLFKPVFACTAANASSVFGVRRKKKPLRCWQSTLPPCQPSCSAHWGCCTNAGKQHMRLSGGQRRGRCLCKLAGVMIKATLSQCDVVIRMSPHVSRNRARFARQS